MRRATSKVHGALSGNIIWLILGIAALVRLLFFLQFQQSPYFQIPLIDSWEYHLDALKISRFGQPHHIAFWHPPGYPYLLAGVYWLSGQTTQFWPIILNMLLGIISLFLTYRIASEFGNNRATLIATALAGMQPVLISFEAQLLSLPMECTLNLLWIWLFIKCTDHMSDYRLSLGAGLVLGSSIITRPTTLLFLPVSYTLLILYSKREAPNKNPAHKPSYRSAHMFLIGTLIMILPVTIRNTIVSGDPVIISTNGGINFFIGNNPNYDHTTALRPGSEWSMLISRVDDKPDTSSSRYWYAEGIAFLTHHPLDAIRLYSWKFFQLLHSNEIIRNLDLQEIRNTSSILRLPGVDFGLLVALGLPGLFLLPSTRKRTILIMYLGLSSLSIILFFMATRYRLPLVHILCFCSSLTIESFVRMWRNRHLTKQDIGILIFTSIVITVTHLPINTGLPEHIQKRDTLMNLADIAERSGDIDRATEHLLEIIRLDPLFPDSYQRLGVYSLRRNDLDAARQYFSLSHERCQGSPLPIYNLGLVSLKEERYQQAAEQFTEALKLNPNNPEFLLYLGEAESELRNIEESRQFFRQAMEKFTERVKQHPYDPGYYRQTAHIAQRLGDDMIARRNWEKAIALDSTDFASLTSLTEILVRLRDFRSAEQYAHRLITHPLANADSFDLMGNIMVALRRYPEAIRAYRKACEKSPHNGSFHNRLAVAFFASGDRKSARYYAEKSRELGFAVDPGFLRILGMN